MTRRVLFLTESREDYLADSLLHGLISIQSSQSLEIVDYPRKDILYIREQICSSDSQISLRGHGFTLYGLLYPHSVDRSFLIQRLQNGYFDLVVFSQVWRQWGLLLDLAPWLQTLPIVLLDGDDDTRIFHHSSTRIRRYGWQSFPVRSGMCLYLKRELIRYPPFTRHCKIYPFSFSIPEEKILSVLPLSKSKTFACHCVDPEVAKASSLSLNYAFASEVDYYADLASSRFAITTRRGGWDCLRHYEIAAAGSVPCVRDLYSKPLSCAPHGLIPGLNCLNYTDWYDLQRQITLLEAMPGEYTKLLKGTHEWITTNTTSDAAKRMLLLVDSL